MATKVFGGSDDLVEFEGDFRGGFGCFGTDDREHGVLVILSDGTILEAKYGKGGSGIWSMTVLKKGNLFDRIDPCDDEDADPHSDVVHLKDGIKFAYAASTWEAVK